MPHTIDAQVQQLAKQVSKGLKNGTLLLRDVVGLTDEEMVAIKDVAESLSRSGSLHRAIAIYGLLLIYDQFNMGYWEAMAKLQYMVGQPAISLACYQAAETLGLDQEQVLFQQVACLQQMGEKKLADELIQLQMDS
ncbi:MAG: hypothetical protein V1754_11055 [Pseudomonadota bacterium]